ncbi:O-Antigen ligase [compost metagenome]
MSQNLRLLLPVAGVAALLSWLVPNHYLPWVVAYNEFAAFLLVLVLAVVTLSGGARVSSSALMMGCLSALPLLQWQFGLIHFFGDALLASIYLAGFSAMLVIGYSCAANSLVRCRVLTWCCAVMLVAAVLSAWIALRQWLMLSGSGWEVPLRPGGRPFANLAQPNNLATLLCVGLAAVLYLFEKRLLGRLSAGMLALFLIMGVALTQSRTPWVGAFCVLLWWAWKSRVIASRLSVIGVAAWCGIYVFVLLVLPGLADLAHLSVPNLAARAQSMQRLDLWLQLWQAVMQGPLWGYGWTQVSVAQIAVAIEHPAPIFAANSHNIFLDLLIWNGPVLGGLIILFLVAWLALLGWRARTAESVIALLAVGFVLVHGLLEFPLEYAFFLFPVGFLLGMIEADEQVSSTFTMARWTHVTGIVLSFGLFVWIWHEYRLIEEDYRLMRFEAARVGNLRSEQKAPDVVLLTQLREFIRFARTEVHDGMSQKELAWMGGVAHRYPYAPSLFNYALALGVNKRSVEAHEQMLILRSLHGAGRYEEMCILLDSMRANYPQLGSLVVRLPRGGGDKKFF